MGDRLVSEHLGGEDEDGRVRLALAFEDRIVAAEDVGRECVKQVRQVGRLDRKVLLLAPRRDLFPRARSDSPVARGASPNGATGTHRHRDVVLLQVVDEFDDAGERLDGPEQRFDFLVHDDEQVVDRVRDPGRLDQTGRRFTRGSTHELRFELPGCNGETL